MSQEPKNNEEGFMYKLASFIVDKRNLLFLIVAIGAGVFRVFAELGAGGEPAFGVSAEGLGDVQGPASDGG